MRATSLISTSQLGERLGIHPRRMFSLLVELGHISRDGDDWLLNETGRVIGGVYREHPRFGCYIAWPSHLRFKDAE